ncbi:fructose-1,6-bisphosphatase [Hominifimenecus sp. rT4P-3]|uniref:fructose-1,6-bisphosphatase n=1 Tax=Hominifimenecus sp. rT4P-3 TaxID=3242979 RepID=UPI003DA33B40
MTHDDKKYLETLSYQFPSIAKASTEIINLSSILQLPKGTEHFMTDIHGEYEQFIHILKNGSGTIRSKIDDVFGFELSQADKTDLATLIYYPEEKIKLVQASGTNMHDWYRTMLLRMIRMTRRVSMKYTRSKVRKSIDPAFVYIIEELVAINESTDKADYYEGILEAIIRTGRATECLSAFAHTIQRLVVNHLHILGDIYDRGPGPHIILDMLMNYHSLDIQWGNHDVVWMGAACGNLACIATALRLTARYGNLDTIEDGYGINLIPLMRFALEYYGDDDCSCFKVKYDPKTYDETDLPTDTKMHKAVAILQFKLEGQLIKRHPEFCMDDRLLLDKIDYENKKLTIYGQTYDLDDVSLPTVDPKDPYKLTEAEEILMEKLQASFLSCSKLQAHVRFLLSKGSLYLVYDNNLLFHGSIPLNADGSFREVTLEGKTYKGKALMDMFDNYVRKAYYLSPSPEKLYATDIIYYLWTGASSPLFGKERMTTFERYFIKDKAAHEEPKTPYYKLYNDEAVVNHIFEEFGLEPEDSHIVNGHVPVKQKKGESPIKCGGKLLLIDGGFSRAYQSTTGIAGYTLISNSYGLKLVYHEPFTSTEDAIRTGSDIHSEIFVVEKVTKRQTVSDTDNGKRLKEQISDLEKLLAAYRSGELRERE